MGESMTDRDTLRAAVDAITKMPATILPENSITVAGKSLYCVLGLVRTLFLYRGEMGQEKVNGCLWREELDLINARNPRAGNAARFNLDEKRTCLACCNVELEWCVSVARITDIGILV